MITCREPFHVVRVSPPDRSADCHFRRHYHGRRFKCRNRPGRRLGRPRHIACIYRSHRTGRRGGEGQQDPRSSHGPPRPPAPKKCWTRPSPATWLSGCITPVSPCACWTPVSPPASRHRSGSISPRIANGTSTLSYKKPSHVFAPYMDEGGDALKALAAELDQLFDKLTGEAAAD